MLLIIPFFATYVEAGAFRVTCICELWDQEKTMFNSEMCFLAQPGKHSAAQFNHTTCVNFFGCLVQLCTPSLNSKNKCLKRRDKPFWESQGLVAEKLGINWSMGKTWKTWVNLKYNKILNIANIWRSSYLEVGQI